MLIRKLPGAVVVSLLIPVGLLAVASPALAAPPRCGHFDIGTGQYVACAATTMTSNSQGPHPTRRVNTTSRSGVAGVTSDSSLCYDNNLVSPPASDPIWSQFLPAGADPADYRLVMSSCEAAGRGGTIFAVRVRNDPPPSAAVVAREAIARLPIPLPAIGVGPNIHRVAVNVPVWLWVSNPGVVSASATDRTVTVTATAVLQSVTWRMGEPGAAPFTCRGAGVASWPGADLWKPPCGYTYRLRSLRSRTGGAGVWPVTATATWAITWRANTGQSGFDTVTTDSTLGLDVGEYRTVILAGNG